MKQQVKMDNLSKALFEASYEALVLFSKEGRVLALNKSAQDLGDKSFWEKIWSQRVGSLVATGIPIYRTELAIGDAVLQCSCISIGEEGFLLVGHDAALERKLRDCEKIRHILQSILDSAYEGIVVVDEKGIITMFNQAYCDFLGVKQEEMIGKFVADVIENTRMHIVVKTGVPEYRQIQRIKGHDMICDRIPVKQDGKIIGAVGKVLFRDVREVEELLSRTEQLRQELEYYKTELRRHQQTRYSLENIVGQSRAISELKDLAVKIARSNSTVLLRGETGTGKELFAHAIHNASQRSQGPFIKINCAAIPEGLLESELFGYEEGAFTGARKGGKTGKFEQAHGGTIFLDEIGEMPLAMQAKLLRVLQEKEIERVGGTRPVKVDVRVIAATNRDLEALVREGKLRQDLFYRLNVITLEIPPLRQRREDIPCLVEFFLEKLGLALGCGKKKISSEAMSILMQHSWPGNVRELENVIERALNVVDGPEILPCHLPYYLRDAGSGGRLLPTLKEAVAAAERDLIKKALSLARGNCLEAARLLGVSKSTFYEKVARYGICRGLSEKSEKMSTFPEKAMHSIG